MVNRSPLGTWTWKRWPARRPAGTGTKVRAEPERAATTESIDGIAASAAAGGGTCAARCEESGWS